MASQLVLKPPGTVLNRRFVIESVLGQGGMGAVYQARHTVLDGPKVAIKEMMTRISNPEKRARALAQSQHEARLLFSLDHPGLVKVLDYFEEGQSQFLVLELVEGSTLNTYIQEPPDTLDPAVVVGWMHEILDVLEYLHTRTPPIIFRDMKPSNLMQDLQGHIRLIDFGIARVLEPELPTESFLKGSGTIGFSPPEQHSGHCDQRSDIYSLGATMYALLTGSNPPLSVARTVEDHLVTPREYNPRVSDELERTILHMLMLNPGQRPQSVAEIREELKGERRWVPPTPSAPPTTLLPPPPTQRLPSPPPKPSRWPALLGTGGSVAAIVWLVLPRPLTPVATVPVVPPSPSATPASSELKVMSHPDTAIVTVDDMPRGLTPLTVKLLKPGPHHITLEKEGYGPVGIDVTLEVGRSLPIDLTLSELPKPIVAAVPAAPSPTPQRPVLSIVSKPVGATVQVDGVVRGVTPLDLVDLPVAVHDFDLQKDGYVTVHRHVEAEQGVTETFTLERFGRLTVKGLPSDAVVRVDDSVETQPSVEMAPGPHALMVTMPGYLDFTQTVQVKPGQDVMVAPRLSLRPRQVIVMPAPVPGIGVSGNGSQPAPPPEPTPPPVVVRTPRPPSRPTPASGVVVHERHDMAPAPTSNATSGIPGY